MRSGKCILVLQGHVKQILGLDFNPQGYQVATGARLRHLSPPVAAILLSFKTFKTAFHHLPQKNPLPLGRPGPAEARCSHHLRVCTPCATWLPELPLGNQSLSSSFAAFRRVSAAGSADHTVRIWDLRKKNCGAHLLLFLFLSPPSPCFSLLCPCIFLPPPVFPCSIPCCSLLPTCQTTQNDRITKRPSTVFPPGYFSKCGRMVRTMFRVGGCAGTLFDSPRVLRCCT